MDHVKVHSEATYDKLSDRTQRVKFFVLVCVAILLVGFFLYISSVIINILSMPVGIIIWTTVITFCLRGPVNFFEKKGLKRGIAVLLTYIIAVAILALLCFAMVSPAFGFVGQFSDLVKHIGDYVALFNTWANHLYDSYSFLFQDAQVKTWLDNAVNDLGKWVSSLATVSAQGVVTVGSTIGNALMAMGFGLVVAYWVLLELPAMGREVKRVFGPKHAEDMNFLYITCTEVMGGYIRGTLIQCVIIGVAAGVIFAILGIPSAAALGVITGLLNIIPVIGPWLGGALAAIVGIFVSPWVSLLALILTIVVQQLVYTFVSPKVLGNAVNIHPALVILALLIGAAIGAAMSGLVGSFVGALLAIPAVAVIKSVFVYYFEKETGRVIVSPDGVLFKGEPKSETTPHPAADATGRIILPEISSAHAVEEDAKHEEKKVEAKLHLPHISEHTPKHK